MSRCMSVQEIPDTDITEQVIDQVYDEGVADSLESGAEGVLLTAFGAIRRGWNDWLIHGVDETDGLDPAEYELGVLCRRSLAFRYERDQRRVQVVSTDPRHTLSNIYPTTDVVDVDMLNESSISNDGWKIADDVLVEIVVNTAADVVTALDESIFTEREFVAFHAGYVFNTTALADVMGDLFDTEYDPGTIRKFDSRAKEKIQQANATLTASEPSGGRVIESADLKSRVESFFTDDLKSELQQQLWRINVGTGRNNYEAIDIAPDYQLAVEYSHNEASEDSLMTHLYVEVSAFDDPVYVDGCEGVDPEHQIIKARPANRELSNFSDYSVGHRETVADIYETIKSVFGEGITHSGEFKSTEAIKRDDGSIFVVFSDHIGIE